MTSSVQIERAAHSRDQRPVVLGHLAAWLFGVVAAVMTVGTLALLYMVDVGAEILLAVVAAVATL
jgi:hypothetical protein